MTGDFDRGFDRGPGRGPSWEQLLSGAHPSFAGPPLPAGRSYARHGRGDWRVPQQWPGVDPDLDWLTADAMRDDAMSWGDAAAWTALLAGGALVLASQVVDLVP